MREIDIKNLIANAVVPGPFTWADFGSGEGAFTVALRELLGPSGTIFSIDKNAKSLHLQQKTFGEQFLGGNITFINSDFTDNMRLPKLNGILMANALHFIQDKKIFLEKLKTYMQPSGKLVVVEYNTDTGNPYVPYPLSFATFQKVALSAGYKNIQKLATAPSTYWGGMYSAIAKK